MVIASGESSSNEAAVSARLEGQRKEKGFQRRPGLAQGRHPIDFGRGRRRRSNRPRPAPHRSRYRRPAPRRLRRSVARCPQLAAQALAGKALGRRRASSAKRSPVPATSNFARQMRREVKGDCSRPAMRHRNRPPDRAIRRPARSWPTLQPLHNQRPVRVCICAIAAGTRPQARNRDDLRRYPRRAQQVASGAALARVRPSGRCRTTVVAATPTISPRKPARLGIKPRISSSAFSSHSALAACDLLHHGAPHRLPNTGYHRRRGILVRQTDKCAWSLVARRVRTYS